jgi:hypothetical protein
MTFLVIGYALLVAAVFGIIFGAIKIVTASLKWRPHRNSDLQL